MSWSQYESEPTKSLTISEISAGTEVNEYDPKRPGLHYEGALEVSERAIAGDSKSHFVTVSVRTYQVTYPFRDVRRHRGK